MPRTGFNRINFVVPNYMIPVKRNIPAGTNSLYHFGTGIIHGVGPFAFFVTFMFYSYCIIVWIYKSTARRFYKFPRRCTYPARMPCSIGFFYVLMYFPGLTYSIMRRYL